MKISQIQIVDNEEKFFIFGIGDDNLMYIWDVSSAKWTLYKL